MIKYRATAYNKSGDTFSFTFVNPNWSGIDEVAANALHVIVINNKMHKQYGPWSYKNIERM